MKEQFKLMKLYICLNYHCAPVKVSRPSETCAAPRCLLSISSLSVTSTAPPLSFRCLWITHAATVVTAVHDQTGDAKQHIKTLDRGRIEFQSSLLQDLDYWCMVWIALIALIPPLCLIQTIYYHKFNDKIWLLGQKWAAGYYCQKFEKRGWGVMITHDNSSYLHGYKPTFFFFYQMHEKNVEQNDSISKHIFVESI